MVIVKKMAQAAHNKADRTEFVSLVVTSVQRTNPQNS